MKSDQIKEGIVGTPDSSASLNQQSSKTCFIGIGCDTISVAG